MTTVASSTNGLYRLRHPLTILDVTEGDLTWLRHN